MAKKAKDEAKSWLWIGIMCVIMALVVIGLLSLIPPEKMSDEPVGYALAAFFFTLGCLSIIFRNKIAQWGTEETSFSERREKPKVAKDKSIGSIGRLLFTIGLLCLAGAYVFYKIVMSSPTMGFLGVFILLFGGVGAISTGVGGGLLILEYQRAWMNRTISTSRMPLSLVRIGLFLFGIGAVIFTIEYVFADIEIRRQHGLYPNIWDLVLQWPLQLYYAFSNPSLLLGLPFIEYIRILIACISPLLALSAIRKLGYPPLYHALWFALALLFPFLLLILAIMPRHSTEIGRRFATAGAAFLFGIFWLAVGLFLLTPFSGDVVYIVGARWFATDSPAVILIAIAGFLLAGLGIAGIVSGILVALGITKPETLERMLERFR